MSLQENAELLLTIQRMQREIDALKTRETPYPAWTAYAPTITAGTGTFTTVSASGQYARVGRIMHVNVTITITTNGTAAGYVIASLPTSAAGNAMGAGAEVSATNRMLRVYAISGTATARAYFYDGTYPGADGRYMHLSIAYPV